MESLLKAVSEFVAAVLGLVGFVGRGHRRTGIREDIELLRELQMFPDDFGRGTFAYSVLTARVALDVAKLAGVDLPSTRRKMPWSGIITAALIGGPLGYLTYALDESGFRWYSTFPAIVAALMAIAILGMLLPEQKTPDTQTQLPLPLDQPEA